MDDTSKVDIDDPLGPQLNSWRKETSQQNIPEFEGNATDDADLEDGELREKYSRLLGDVKCVLIDLDGTLFNIRLEDTAPTPSALEALERLRKTDLKIIFVVNTWLMSKKNVVEQLQSVGFQAEEKEIFTSSDCCKIFMEKHSCKHPFLLVADDVMTDFEEFETSDPLQLDSVILGLPSTLIDYRLLTKTFMMLESGKPMILLNPAKLEKAEGSSCVLGPGLFGSILEFSTDTTKFVSGKPTLGFFTEACKYAGFPTTHCLMIGDDIDEDIKGANSAGLKGILVKTGKYKKYDERKYCGFKPEGVAENFATAVRFICCAKSTDPLLSAAAAKEALRKAKIQINKDDFTRRLNAYASDDVCRRDTSGCVQKLPSFIW